MQWINVGYNHVNILATYYKCTIYTYIYISRYMYMEYRFTLKHVSTMRLTWTSMKKLKLNIDD